MDEKGPDATMPRRDFIRLTGAAAVVAAGGPMIRTQTTSEFAKLVPAEKDLPADWVKSLTARGERAVYRGKDLKFIGMPVGGVCAGQVFLGGDGRLWLWDVFNQIKFGVVEKTILFRGSQLNAGGGANYVESPEQVHPFAQGCAIHIKQGSKEQTRAFDFTGWKDVSFSGEYPIGFVEYRDPESPVAVDLEAFSPYVPLDTESSSFPATVLRYTVKNTLAHPVTVRVAGWMENAIGLHSTGVTEAMRRNVLTEEEDHTRIDFSISPHHASVSERPEIVFDDFEGDTYTNWTVTGSAFGDGPTEKSKMPKYQGDVGGHGKRVVNSHNVRTGGSVEHGDSATGRMVSHDFVVKRHFIRFFIGGGNHPGKTCMNLLVDGQVVRTATGHDSNQMRLDQFDVTDLAGKTAHLEIVDEETGAWGNIGIDDIVFTDRSTATPLHERPDVGQMSFAMLGRATVRHFDHVPSLPAAIFSSHEPAVAGAKPSRPLSGLVREKQLGPGETETFTFIVAWRFPNLTLPVIGAAGHHYAKRFPTSALVVRKLVTDFDELYERTTAWHKVWYDSTLPYWLLDRVGATSSTLATMTCVRFADGRFYGWEGIGCCEGTCGHVWQYAHAMARLFPDLERTVREKVDFGLAFHPDTGIIEFRGEYGNGYAADSQAGYVLRAYREHQCSANDGFLKRIYPQAKKALEYLIEQDADGDGIIENRQHNTLDVNLYGPSSWLTSLYLAALRAGEEMAIEMGDAPIRDRCRAIFQSGTKKFVPVLWNGEYFIHKPDPKYPDALRYGDGCEVDQVMGQGWAWQVGLGRIIDEAYTKKALKALYRNNFLPHVGPYRERFKPGRWYAMPDEAGLLICTFPKGDREEILGNSPTWASMYFNECMTGFEYEAAGHMVAEGLVTQGLAVTRAVHDRYHPSRRNPYNEVECSDHYARCMAAYGVFIAACGFEYHGPKGHIGFAPRFSANNFKAPFTTAEGWGTFEQRLDGRTFEASLSLHYGSLNLKTISLEPPTGSDSVTVNCRGRDLPATVTKEGRRALVTLANDFLFSHDETLTIVFA